jgi:hypothetical protein
MASEPVTTSPGFWTTNGTLSTVYITMTWSMLLPTMQPDNNWATNGTFSGRAVIQGKVLSIKSNDFSARILVQLTDGWKVFGTLPSSISRVEREQAVVDDKWNTFHGLYHDDLVDAVTDYAAPSPPIAHPGHHRPQREIPLHPSHQANSDPATRFRTSRYQSGSYPVTAPALATNKREFSGLSIPQAGSSD